MRAAVGVRMKLDGTVAEIGVVHDGNREIEEREWRTGRGRIRHGWLANSGERMGGGGGGGGMSGEKGATDA